MANKIFLVTHGETALDRQGRLHGQRVDASLSRTGQHTARTAAGKLAGKNIDCIYCSPLKRARETAQIIAGRIHAKVEPREELLPWDIARMSGAKLGAVRPLIEFFSGHPARPIPGGESKQKFLDRYRAFFAEMKREAKEMNLAIVGHSQHSLTLPYAQSGRGAAQVPMVGGEPGEVRTIQV